MKEARQSADQQSANQQSADSVVIDSEVTEPGKVDIEGLMNRIRSKARASAQSQGLPKYRPPAAVLFDGSTAPILYSDELNFLNAHWNDWAAGEPYISHRPILGKLIVWLKTRLRQFVTQTLLASYLERERQFVMQLIRHLNASARYIDSRDSALFWQLNSKTDNDVSAANDRTDRLFTELVARMEALEAKLANPKHRVSPVEPETVGAVPLASSQVEQIFTYGELLTKDSFEVCAAYLDALPNNALVRIHRAATLAEDEMIALLKTKGLEPEKLGQGAKFSLEQTVEEASFSGLPLRYQEVFLALSREIQRLNAQYAELVPPIVFRKTCA